MDSHRGKRMKIRLEIIGDDDTENTSIEFGGPHWKTCILAFIDSLPYGDKISVESSSDSLPVSSISQGQQPTQSLPAQPQVSQEPLVQQPAVQQPVIQSTTQQQQQQPVVTQPLTQVYQQPAPHMSPMPPSIYGAPGVMPYYYYTQPVQTPPFVQGQIPPAPAQQPAQAASTHAEPVAQQAPVQNAAPTRQTPHLQEKLNDSSLTISERLELFLKYEYPRVWFSSQDVQQHYERVYGPIKQSTVSTYLSRMFRKNILERRGNRTQREYKYIDVEMEMPVISSNTPISEYYRL